MRIDARDPAVLERVAGLPLLLRHARMLSRSGTRSARFFVGAEGRSSVEAVRCAPADLAVEVVTGPPDGPALDGALVYSASLEPVGDARTPAGRLAADCELERRIKKSVDLDGVVAYYVMRPLSRLLTRIRRRGSPPIRSRCAPWCAVSPRRSARRAGAPSSPASSTGSAPPSIVLTEIWRVCVSRGSRLGEWLDTLADDVSTLAVVVGLGIGLAADGYGPGWQVFAIVGAGVGLLTAAKLYADLHRLGLPIDTAQYPWFFGSPGTCPGPLGKLFYAVSFSIPARRVRHRGLHPAPGGFPQARPATSGRRIPCVRHLTVRAHLDDAPRPSWRRSCY